MKLKFQPLVQLGADRTTVPESGYDYQLSGAMDLSYDISMQIVGTPEKSTQFQLPDTPEIFKSGFLPDSGTGVTYTLDGTILNQNNNPVALVEVSAYDTLSEELIGTDFTTAAGEYTIFDFPEGREVRVVPVLAGWLFDPVEAAVLMDGDKTQDFSAAPDPSYFTVFGQVVDLSGSGQPNVTISAYETGGGDLVSAATTDTLGQYQVWAIPGGIEVDVVPRKAGYHFVPPAVTVVMDGNKEQDFESISGTDYFQLHGDITDGIDPIGNVQVALEDLDTGDPIDTAVTSASGIYIFDFIEQGLRVKVTPSLAGYEFTPPSATLLMDDDKVQNFNGTSTGMFYSVFGVVTGPAGEEVQVEVHLLDDGSLLGSDLTAPDGSYSIAGIPADVDVYVVPSKLGYSFDPPVANLFMDSDKEQNFVSSEASYALWGTITDGVDPLDGVSVDLVDADTSDPLGTDTTGSTGTYLFEGITAGTNVKVTPSLAGYEFDPPSATLLMDEDKVQNFTGSALSDTNWVHTYGSADQERVWRVVVSSNGDQYIAGQIFSGEGSIYGFVEKRNTYGQFQWYKEFQPPTGYNSVLILDMAVIPGTGEVITAGYAMAAETRAWVMRIDAAGSVLQSRIGPTSLPSLANQIVREVSSGDYYVVGQGTDTEEPFTSTDVLVMKFDGDSHDLAWAELIEGSKGELPTGCKLDGDGNLVVVGDYTSGAPTFTDSLVLKVNSNGTLKWGGVFDVGSATTYTEGLVIGPSNEVYVLGNWNSAATIVRINDLDTSGSLSWARLWFNEGSSAISQFYDGLYDSAASTIIVCGSTGDEIQSKSNGLIVEFNSTATSTNNDIVWRNGTVDASTIFTAIARLAGGEFALGGDSLNTGGSWGTATNNINPSPSTSSLGYDGAVEVLVATLDAFAPDVSSPARTEDAGAGQADALSLRRSALP